MRTSNGVRGRCREFERSWRRCTHEPLYFAKASRSGSAAFLRRSRRSATPCNFSEAEVLTALAVTILKVTGQELLVSENVLPTAESQRELLKLAAAQGAHPQILRR